MWSLTLLRGFAELLIRQCLSRSKSGQNSLIEISQKRGRIGSAGESTRLTAEVLFGLLFDRNLTYSPDQYPSDVGAVVGWELSRVVFDPRGFRYTFFLERFNKVTSKANTSVDKYLVDVHLEVTASYLCLLLEFPVPQRDVEKLTRELLSIGWLRWHVMKMYRQIQKRLRRIYVNIKDGLGGRGNDDH